MIDRLLDKLGAKPSGEQAAPGDETTRPSEAMDTTLIPPEGSEHPDLPGIVWPLEPLLDRVIHEPNAVRYLHPDDILKLEVEARMAVDRQDATRALAIATVWSFHGRVPDTCDDLLKLALLPRGKWAKKSPVARASEVEQRIGPARMERLEA